MRSGKTRLRQLLTRTMAVLLALVAVLGTVVTKVVEKWLEAPLDKAGQTAGGWLTAKYQVSLAVERTGPTTEGAIPVSVIRVLGWEALGIVLVLLLLAALLGWILYRWVTDLQQQLDTDPQTGTLGPRGLRRRFDRRREEVSTQSPLVMVLLDLIGFHEFNLEYGQAGGDKILAAVSRRLRGETKFKEDVGRYGGDEFMLLMEGDLTSLQFGLKARQKELKDIVVQEVGTVEVRFRAGMTEVSNESFDAAYEKASQALRDARAVPKECHNIEDVKTYVQVWKRNPAKTWR